MEPFVLGSAPAAGTGLFARVAIPVPVHQLFTYAVPAELADQLAPGVMVEVPFGHRWLVGYVIEVAPASDVADVKPIRRLAEPQPVFSDDVLTLMRAVAAYYLTPLGLVLKAALPGGLSKGSQRQWFLTEAGQRCLGQSDQAAEPSARAVLEALARHGPCAAGDIEEHVDGVAVGEALTAMARRGLVRAATAPNKTSARLTTFYHVNPEIDMPGRLGKRQLAVIDLLRQHDWTDAASLNSAIAGASSVARQLARRGLIDSRSRRVHRVPRELLGLDAEPPHTLAPAQQAALEAIDEAMRERRAESFLVHGVTGSGKTELYLHAINLALERQRGAIVLAPEISLTPQLVARFRGRFGELVALQHSGLSAGERLDEWERIRQGEARIVVGVRSAIFSPVHNLGIIVVDEEQENSYKQEEGILYDAREVAALRAAQSNAVVVHGSATPTLESYYDAQRRPGAYLPLPERVTTHALPEVTVVDMRRQPHTDGRHHYLSAPLVQALTDCLDRGEQSMLFLNRRGFSTAMLCRDCGYTLMCPQCSVTLTYHQPQQLARCHYCDHREPVSDLCPLCRSPNYQRRGFGTQQLEAAVRELFPTARVQRMDRDTTRRRHAFHTLLRELARGRLDILLGTQMIAKGHDYPSITLVGVVSADALLSLPDFRAAARTFQLLTQVAGRAGRGDLPGKVIVQTYNPEHYAVMSAQRHEYTMFYGHEIEARRAHFYPPFSYLALIRVHSRDETLAMQASTHLAMQLRKQVRPPSSGESLPESGFEVLGPAPAVLSRLKGRYRWHVLVKARDAQWLRRELERVLLPEVAALSRRAAVAVDLDLNPQSVL